VELLKQGLNSPMPVEEQVVVIYAGTNGYVDGIPVDDVNRYEDELLAYMGTRHSALMSDIRSSGDVDGTALQAAVEAFTAQFATSADADGGDATGSGDDDAASED